MGIRQSKTVGYLLKQGYPKDAISRRRFLQTIGAGAGATGLAMAGCAAPAPQTIVQTVEVEKVVEKEVIRTVEVEKEMVVEKEVLRTVEVEKIVEKDVVRTVEVRGTPEPLPAVGGIRTPDSSSLK